MQALLEQLLPTSDFVQGAFDFWQKTYARELSGDDIPDLWKPLLTSNSKDAITRFTYALETSYLLAARLMLAKAIQDHDQDERIAVPLADRFGDVLSARVNARTGKLEPTAYLTALQTLFDDYATTLFTSIYAQDLFDWWRDYPTAPPNQQNALALAVARLLLSLIRFDFSQLQGDLLGALYQNYFDPDTRKALGEFYTPPEVVEFILDEVGYQGEGRLLDPATGSGTFLIHALRRYLKAREQKRDAADILKGLSQEFLMVAFDVNPFAVMMAQVNMAAQLVPLYTKAIAEDKHFTLRRLPIVRTDSLRQEVIEGDVLQTGDQYGINFEAETIKATITLPVKQGSSFLTVTLEFPRLEAAKKSRLIRNEREWLLALQSVFVAVETRSQAFDAAQVLPNLQEKLRTELANYQTEPDALTAYLLPYAEKVWDVLEDLKTNHGDGRFLKTLEDLMLGLVLKHYMQYDFVVGNPPYVRIQNIPEVLKQAWEGKYSWAQGSYDIFVPFIERVVYGDRPWLKNGGKLGYIVPNRFLNANYARALRENLPKSARVLSISDFKAVTFAPPEDDQASRLFKEAMVYPAILVIEKGSPMNDTYAFRAARFFPKPAPLHPREAMAALRDAFRDVRQGDYQPLRTSERDYADVFWQDSTVLAENGWYVMPEHERKVFDHLEKIGDSTDESLPVTKQTAQQKRRLESYTATSSAGFQGIKTGKDGLFILSELEQNDNEGLLLLQPSDSSYSPAWIEKDALQPFLFGRDVEKYHANWQKRWVIFPYFLHKARYLLFPSTEYWEFTSKNRKVFEGYPEESPLINKQFPHLWQYLKKHERELRAREGGRYKKKKSEEFKWYKLARPQNLEWNSAEKVLLQELGKTTTSTIDRDGFVIAGARIYGIVPANIDLGFLGGLVPSYLSDFYIKHVATIYGGGFYSYGDQFIKDLPIPETTETQREQIAGLAQALTEKTALLREREKQVQAFPASVTQLRFDHPEQSNPPDLEDLSRLVSTNKLAKNLDVQKLSEATTLTGETVLKIGRGELHGKAGIMALVRRVLELNGKMESETLLALEVPLEAHEQTTYLQTLASWQTEIVTLQNEIDALEKQLNTAVYDAYGLTAADREIVEGFLARF